METKEKFPWFPRSWFDSNMTMCSVPVHIKQGKETTCLFFYLRYNWQGDWLSIHTICASPFMKDPIVRSLIRNLCNMTRIKALFIKHLSVGPLCHCFLQWRAYKTACQSKGWLRMWPVSKCLKLTAKYNDLVL